jgi:hypothetical protein
MGLRRGQSPVHSIGFIGTHKVIPFYNQTFTTGCQGISPNLTRALPFQGQMGSHRQAVKKAPG